jgi:hypothetical protein
MDFIGNINHMGTVKSEQSLADGLQSVKLKPVHQLHVIFVSFYD